ncbi:hypothetical protein GZ77_20590 [Endozoicomonas montiporae]|uniref:Uncharacterized protein n=2 Tax=Endozoicomonas montiporae TaxID=1027273 RepID=A0A081N322_9GAMM|nr:hypothetical protein [Endozoicomonas montiporae]AMO58135.1 hypothetical protein EZMO1_4212 [Endozoicomonas montiporae CL-33]KEQ12845.1 hypothetical protein GZ77_20590 [Endozoicomonas montiporae]
MSNRDQEKLKQVERMLKDNPGMFNNQVAAMVGVSETTVTTFRRALGIPSRNEYLFNEAKRLFTENPDRSVDGVAWLLSVNRATVSNYRKRLGLNQKRKSLTEAQRKHIVHLFTVEKLSKVEISRQMQLHWTTVSRIVESAKSGASMSKRLTSDPVPAPSLINQLLMQSWKQTFCIDRSLVEA